MLLKLGLIAIALLVGSVVVFQTAGQVFQDPDERPGIRLNEEVTRTNRTAGRLDNSFANVLPPMPVRRNVSFTLPDGQASSVAPRSSVLSDSDGEVNPAPGAPSQPGLEDDSQTDSPEVEAEPAPTPDRYPAYNNPVDRSASEAAAFSDRMVDELEIQETEYTRAVQQFYDGWSTRYNLAIDAHKRFRWRVNRVETIAAEYFQHQTNLTNLMPNPERREVFRLRDQQEKDLYRQWQFQANDILSQSNMIMAELRQLNLEITKMRLSANFVALHQEFQTIPQAVTQLHDDLDIFRARSEQLQQNFNSGTVHNQ